MSNQGKWTPGPWHVPKAGGYAHGPVDKNDVPVVTWTGMARPRQENGMANANLIAAAPELYEALENIVTELEETGFQGEWDSYPQARAALAEARGEQV